MSKSPRKGFSSQRLSDLRSPLSKTEIQSTEKILEDKDYLSKENHFNKIKAILLKTQRTQIELFVLQKYLSTLPNLMLILNESGGDINHLLTKIALYLKYERIAPNTVICRLGEKGNKFYVILDGVVSILIPKEIKINMTLFQYVQHLFQLLIIDEKEILIMTLKQNRLTYPIEIEVLKDFMNNLEKPNLTLINFDCIEINQMKSFIETTITSYNNKQKYPIRTVDEYIKESQPVTLNHKTKNASDLIKSNKMNIVSVFIYFEVTQLTKGSTFGERALLTAKNKRTATILSEEGALLGTLTRNGFDLCIKDIQKKIQHATIRFFLSFKIFSSLSWYLFSYKFLNFFKQQTLIQNQMLMNENNTANEIFFVREGEFEVSAKMSDNEVDYYINLLRNQKKYILINNNSNADGKKKVIRIASFKEHDIIGLDDMMHKGRYIFSARCISYKAIIYSIEIKAFETIVSKINNVSESVKEFVEIRKDILASRLESYKYIQLTHTIEKEIKTKTVLDQIQSYFSIQPKCKSREKINKKTKISHNLNKELFLTSIKSEVELISVNNHHLRIQTGRERYKTRNCFYLGQCDPETFTTSNLITMTQNNLYNHDGINHYKEKQLLTKYSQANSRIHSNKSRQKQADTIPERLIKKMAQSSYKSIFLSELKKPIQQKSLSGDKETIISIVDFGKYDEKGNIRNLKMSKNDCPVVHRILSPKQLPLNYMDKAKPLRISMKKKQVNTDTNGQI